MSRYEIRLLTDLSSCSADHGSDSADDSVERENREGGVEDAQREVGWEKERKCETVRGKEKEDK